MRIFFTLLLLTTVTSLKAQPGYEVTKDSENPKGKILRGTISKYLLQQDSSFQWYGPNHKLYQPDTGIVKAFARVKTDKLQLVVFGGTWCEDTQFIIPKFFRLQEMSGVPDDHITFFGVNRDKFTLGHIAEALGVLNVPTIIVMKSGKELGRVVEYGKTGKWDKELAAIISSN